MASNQFVLFVIFSIQFIAPIGSVAQELRALIVDGQNNHEVWPKTTAMMKDYLEQTGMFEVHVARTAFTWQGGKEGTSVNDYPVKGMITVNKKKSVSDPDFKPEFSKYDVVISNFGWEAAPWPRETEEALEKFVQEGGGVVIVHAANNSFPEWEGYNKMAGIGGWGDRNEKHGPYVYYDDNGEMIRDQSPGPAGSHGPQHEFVITVRESSHPIMKGLPKRWLHTKDELYDRLRGPAENLNVLATAFSDQKINAPDWPDVKGTGRHEPMLMTTTYGAGRVFHTVMGHADYSMECTGFIITFQRGTEWAATGKVTQRSFPDDFPTVDESSQRSWEQR